MGAFTLDSAELRKAAAKEFQNSMGGCRIEKLLPWDEIGVPEPAQLNGETFAALNYEQRRAVIDGLQDIGMLNVYEKKSTPERREAQLQLGEQFRTAKWRYALALVSEAYGLGYNEVDLEIMAPLCAQLATIERGETNQHMPCSHKLRHNPAVHSLHVAMLIKDVFDEVRANGGLEEKDIADSYELQHSLLRAALVHDMGELKGELSIASNRKNMTPEEMQRFEHNRGLTETEVFSEGVAMQVARLESQQWQKEEVAARAAALLQDYDVAEGAENVFAGRAHKTMERIQSQQDYMRFEGKSFAPVLSTIIPAEGNHKDFMRNYALEPFRGTANGTKVRKSLAELAEEAPNAKLAQAIVETLDARLQTHQQQVDNATNYKGELSFRDKFIQEGALHKAIRPWSSLINEQNETYKGQGQLTR